MEDSNSIDDTIVPETQPAASQLDTEIEHIRSQIRDLIHRRSILSSAILSNPSSHNLLSSNTNPPNPPSSPRRSALQKLLKTQHRENLKSTYRLCVGATLFESRDPDPYAVDNGHVLGVRIEVFDRKERKFAKQHYILLNKPYAQDKERLKVHRHTLPPCIPLKRLVDKWLPAPISPTASDPDEGVVLKEQKQRKQDFPRLVRETRRELISYQRRKEAVQALKENLKREDSENTIQGIEAVDAEIQDLRIDWADGDAARIRMNQKGDIEKIIFLGKDDEHPYSLPKKVASENNSERIENLHEMILKIKR